MAALFASLSGGLGAVTAESGKRRCCRSVAGICLSKNEGSFLASPKKPRPANASLGFL